MQSVAGGEAVEAVVGDGHAYILAEDCLGQRLADGRGQLEAVAAEANGNVQAVVAGNRADDGVPVGGDVRGERSVDEMNWSSSTLGPALTGALAGEGAAFDSACSSARRTTANSIEFFAS